MYVPNFRCAYCGNDTAPISEDGTVLLMPCSCKESMDASVQRQYIESERKKKIRRGEKP